MIAEQVSMYCSNNAALSNDSQVYIIGVEYEVCILQHFVHNNVTMEDHVSGLMFADAVQDGKDTIAKEVQFMEHLRYLYMLHNRLVQQSAHKCVIMEDPVLVLAIAHANQDGKDMIVKHVCNSSVS